ncbi:hypothetical protein [Pseudomonas sp. zfem005]
MQQAGFAVSQKIKIKARKYRLVITA